MFFNRRSLELGANLSRGSSMQRMPGKRLRPSRVVSRRRGWHRPRCHPPLEPSWVSLFASPPHHPPCAEFSDSAFPVCLLRHILVITVGGLRVEVVRWSLPGDVFGSPPAVGSPCQSAPRSAARAVCVLSSLIAVPRSGFFFGFLVPALVRPVNSLPLSLLGRCRPGQALAHRAE